MAAKRVIALKTDTPFIVKTAIEYFGVKNFTTTLAFKLDDLAKAHRGEGLLGQNEQQSWSRLGSL